MILMYGTGGLSFILRYHDSEMMVTALTRIVNRYFQYIRIVGLTGYRPNRSPYTESPPVLSVDSPTDSLILSTPSRAAAATASPVNFTFLR